MSEDYEREQIANEMRNNLIARNGGKPLYTKGYFDRGKIIDISTANVELLFEVDGDMCPLGK